MIVIGVAGIKVGKHTRVFTIAAHSLGICKEINTVVCRAIRGYPSGCIGPSWMVLVQGRHSWCASGNQAKKIRVSRACIIRVKDQRRASRSTLGIRIHQEKQRDL